MGLLLLQGSAALNPRELFASGEQGLWLDPSDFSTMWQDAAGDTPVTAASDPVALILDKSRSGPSMGSNQVTNGGFGADSDWTKGTGWTIGSGVATKTAGSASLLSQAQTMTVGRYYIVTYTITRTAGSITPQFAGGSTVSGTARSTSGTFTDIMTVVSGNNTLQFSADASFAGTVDNVSLKQLSAGNHAYQTTSASRPTLARIPSSGRRNLLTYSEDITNAAWTKTNVTAASALNLTYNGLATPAAAFLSQLITIAGGTASKSFTLRVVLSGSGKVRIRNTHSAVLDNFSSDITLTSTPTAYTLTVTNSASPGNGIQSFGINPATDNSTFDVTVSQFQAEQSATATSYQKVVATTDVTESGVSDLWHLVFDGSDDSLVTNAVDFSATDEMTVIAGVRKLSDAANACIAELSATYASNAGTFAFFTGTPIAAGGELHLSSRGAATASTSQAGVSAAFASPVSLVATAFADISGDSSSMRINGAASGTTGTGEQGSGNYGNYQLFIGRRNQSQFPFTGHIYQLIVRGKTTPTGKLLEAERFVARKTGVAI